MRLTLRTLLAWLDDALPADQAREIGRQVSDSPYAQKLIERMRHVSRRRRVSVPANNGPEAVDPNLVAAYIDNELDSDQVAEYEKLCLGSDVNLSEVVSAHQVLSLINQKARVPAEARYRMYRLVKGRESIAPERLGASADLEPAAPPWEVDSPEPTPLWQPLALAGAVLASLGLLGWAAWGEGRQAGRLLAQAATAPEAPAISLPNLSSKTDAAANPLEERRQLPPVVEAAPVAPAVDEEPPVAPPESNEAAPEEPKAEGGEEAPAAVPPAPDDGSAAQLARQIGVIVRSEPVVGQAGQSTWKRLNPAQSLAPGDQVANFEPYRTELRLNPDVKLLAVGEARFVTRGAEGDLVRLGWLNGRGLIETTAKPRKLALSMTADGDPVVEVDIPAATLLGVERLARVIPGQPPLAPWLVLHIPRAKLGLRTSEGDASVEGPAIVLLDPEGKAQIQRQASVEWVSNPNRVGPIEEEASRNLVDFFGPNAAIEFGLIEAVHDPRPAIHGLAARALGELGKLDLLLPLLSEAGPPSLRAAVLQAIQSDLAIDPAALDQLKSLLPQYTEGPEVANALERLLIGIDPATTAAGPEPFEFLVKQLDSPNPGVRTLAIETLRRITGRDALGYNPEQPTPAAYEAWRQLLRNKQLRPNTPPAGGTTPESAAPASAPTDGPADEPKK